MYNPITYNFITAKDAEIFKPLRLRSLKEEPDAFFFTFNEMKDKPLSYWQSLLEKDYNIGAFENNRLIGFSGMWPEEGEKICHRAYMGAVYVVPEARGRGIARKMIECLLEKAEEIRLEIIRLSTNSNNEVTVGLYKSMGFETYGIEKNYLKLSHDSYIDEVLMVKYLK